MLKKLLLVILMSNCSAQCSLINSVQSTFSSLLQTVKKNPITTSAIIALGVCILAYTLIQFQSKNVAETPTIKSSEIKHPENFLFVHGFAETHEQAYWYTGKSGLPVIIEGKLFTYDFPDVTDHFWRVNFTQTSLGQLNEILGLQSAYDQTLEILTKDPRASKDLILMGVSRGATTILNFMGLHNPQHVKALIIESAFDTTQTIAENILKKLHLTAVPGMKNFAHGLVSAFFWKHSRRGIYAKDNVKKIDKNIPILFICSEEDGLIPASSTVALYNALKESGHTKVHIFIAQHGTHGRILHGPDGKNYQAIAHAFYKHYGMHYHPKLAEQGQDLFAQSNP